MPDELRLDRPMLLRVLALEWIVGLVALRNGAGATAVSGCRPAEVLVVGEEGEEAGEVRWPSCMTLVKVWFESERDQGDLV